MSLVTKPHRVYTYIERLDVSILFRRDIDGLTISSDAVDAVNAISSRALCDSLRKTSNVSARLRLTVKVAHHLCGRRLSVRSAFIFRYLINCADSIDVTIIKAEG